MGGWLLCDGAAYLKTAYPYLNLFLQNDGYPYGSDATHFNVPDHRKRAGRGVGSGQALGDHEGVTDETQRNEDHGRHHNGKHGKHPRHKHKHRHRKKYVANDGTQNLNHDLKGSHDHGVGSLSTTFEGVSVPKVAGTGSSVMAGHSHGVQGRVGEAGSLHDHLPHQTPTDANARPDAGATDLFSDSTVGGSGYDGGPTDEYGTPIQVAEDDDGSTKGHQNHVGANGEAAEDQDSVKGHRKHPHIRFRYWIKY